jgi:hypothetical protein
MLIYPSMIKTSTLSGFQEPVKVGNIEIKSRTLVASPTRPLDFVKLVKVGTVKTIMLRPSKVY